ncbi:hypothetical protein C8R45DRAFT_1076557 [Mycena sanguinolenta]|nr:hypothetical protein C8R45DRAFT_1076557 [Mycena sanguinolenta]
MGTPDAGNNRRPMVEVGNDGNGGIRTGMTGSALGRERCSSQAARGHRCKMSGGDELEYCAGFGWIRESRVHSKRTPSTLRAKPEWDAECSEDMGAGRQMKPKPRRLRRAGSSTRDTQRSQRRGKALRRRRRPKSSAEMACIGEVARETMGRGYSLPAASAVLEPMRRPRCAGKGCTAAVKSAGDVHERIMRGAAKGGAEFEIQMVSHANLACNR